MSGINGAEPAVEFKIAEIEKRQESFTRELAEHLAILRDIQDVSRRTNAALGVVAVDVAGLKVANAKVVESVARLANLAEMALPLLQQDAELKPKRKRRAKR